MGYKYEGIELTPNVFVELLIQFYDGKQFKRQDAIDKITTYHAEQGGLLDKTEYVSVFKKASAKLRDEGLQQRGYGVWQLLYKKKEIDEIVKKENTKDVELKADKEIGVGKKAVYVYYYDRYREFSLLKGYNVWECKIGRTDVDPLGRIFSQAGTCYPELPHLALLINCDDSSLLEKTLHDILRMRKRWLHNAPGKEWFLTSPEEIESIFKWLQTTRNG